MHFSHKREDEGPWRFQDEAAAWDCTGGKPAKILVWEVLPMIATGQPWSKKERMSQKTAGALPENPAVRAAHAAATCAGSRCQRQERDSSGLIALGRRLSHQLQITA